MPVKAVAITASLVLVGCATIVEPEVSDELPAFEASGARISVTGVPVAVETQGMVRPNRDRLMSIVLNDGGEYRLAIAEGTNISKKSCVPGASITTQMTAIIEAHIHDRKPITITGLPHQFTVGSKPDTHPTYLKYPRPTILMTKLEASGYVWNAGFLHCVF